MSERVKELGRLRTTELKGHRVRRQRTTVLWCHPQFLFPGSCSGFSQWTVAQDIYAQHTISFSGCFCPWSLSHSRKQTKIINYEGSHSSRWKCTSAHHTALSVMQQHHPWSSCGWTLVRVRSFGLPSMTCTRFRNVLRMVTWYIRKQSH